MNGQGYSFKTHSYDTPGPRFPYAVIIRDAIINAIWNGELSTWDSAMGDFGDRALGRDFTANEIYIWVNQNPGEIEERTGPPHTKYFHKNYSHNDKRYIDVLKAIVNGRKRVLDKYKAAENATPSEIDALEKKFKLPDNVRDWLKTQELTESQKQLFNLMPDDSGADAGASAEATAGTSAGASAEATDADAGSSAETTGAGGRRRRKTSFRRRRMSRCRSSKSKSKSKKSRKSRKCVR